MDWLLFGRRLAGVVCAGVLGLIGALPVRAAPLQVAMLAPPSGEIGGAGFSVRWGEERSALAVNPLVAAAGQAVTLQVEDAGRGVFTLDAGAGVVQPLGAARWRWTAPGKPGSYTLEVARSDGARMRFTALITTPRTALRGGALNGYLIGDYPQHPAGQALYRPPEGFIEVDARSAALPLTPHLTLGQFVCKQAARGPRYVVLRERLPLALEAALQRFARAGIAAGGLTVMSGYRTPHYNRQLGDTRFSRHQFGDAADIFIDEDGDGRMDDLNGDGRHDIGDARLLFGIVDAAQREPAWQRFTGGLSAYPPNAAHGAFVHLDTRGVKARW
ncbi:D-Ala-D-Ala carboxypeptidase family metallohydrolase [Immundisolibacter sp.]|uniref:D-Ala-D-Ala carboxypeptidase family metallohydrolase n=1 Tax=Immundisolibacter sp. TaxID=1934948 RepID=UPI0026114D23|nr:D-Ala-D-Ala carboxypeptidase family metallohydrolase [Immundisolibacter sp.]MDD3650931.1 D-Ala-D-Ala carboxypeptidase family metallohydrolase [Immundisolibacter sp.]